MLNEIVSYDMSMEILTAPHVFIFIFMEEQVINDLFKTHRCKSDTLKRTNYLVLSKRIN